MGKFKAHQTCFLLILIMGIFLIAGCDGEWLPPKAMDNRSPIVMTTKPVNGITGVPVNRAISAIFSEAMAPSTITDETFIVEQGGTAITGSVYYSDVTAIFVPSINLDTKTRYTATITTRAENLVGNALASDYVWSFTTGNGLAPDVVILGRAGTFGIMATGSTAGTVLIQSLPSLDAGGNVDAVSIFQFGSSLTTFFKAGENPEGNVLLVNGAQAKQNVTI